MTYIIKLKRFFCITVAMLTLFASLSFVSCKQQELYREGSDGVRVLCTVFAPFDFVRAVGGDLVTVTLLQDSGADLHNYTPTAATLEALSDADIFIYIGGVSDQAWVGDALHAAGNKDLSLLCLMDHVDGVYAELENDWSEHDSEHNEHNEHNDSHEDDHDHDHEHEHDHGADEHIWTSVRNAIRCTEAIRDLLCETDPSNADTYFQNADEYVAKLKALDLAFAETADAFTHMVESKPIVFADRFPFVYLMHDYHIPYKAAFSGCSTEVNASFDMQLGLIKAVRDHKLSFVAVTEGNDKALAEAVVAETGCKILVLNSLQSVKRSDIENGLTYLDVMQNNLMKLQEACQWN